MPKEIVLLLRADGKIEGLWNDIIPWTELGHCEVTRASSVEFNPEEQKWEVILADGTLVGKWPSREEAIEQEISYLQERM